MTNGFGKLLFQNHNGSMRITGSPFIRSFIRVFITGKLAPTCALHNFKVSRAQISTVFYYEAIHFGILIEQSVCQRNLYEICSTFFECSLVFSSFYSTCMMCSPFFCKQHLFSSGRKWYIFLSGFLVPNVMKNEVER